MGLYTTLNLMFLPYGAKEIYELLYNSANYLLAFNILLFLKTVVREKIFIIFFCYLLTVGVIQFYSTYLFNKRINNIWLSHYYFISQFLFLSFFYYYLLKKRKIRIVIGGIIIFTMVVFTFQYLIEDHLFEKYNSLGIFFTQVVISSYAVIYFLNTLTKEKSYSYINSGIFIYMLTSSLIFAAGNLLVDTGPSLYMYFWVLNAFFCLLYQILINIEWWKSFYRKKTD